MPIRKPSTDDALRRFRDDFQGAPGSTPVKGVDYFTPEELSAIIEFITTQIPAGQDGADGGVGETGETGDAGRPGYSPVKGADYWTKQDQAKILAEVEKLFTARIPTVEAVISKLPKVEKQEISYKDIKDAPDVSSLPKLIEFLNRGGFRGGGDTVAAGDNVTIVTNANGQKVISATASGSTTVTTPTGTVNGINTFFTVTSIPKWVDTDTGHYYENFGYIRSTFGITMDLAPNTFIRAVS